MTSSPPSSRALESGLTTDERRPYRVGPLVVAATRGGD